MKMNRPLTLTGLDASNPLAFLAALGTLRSLSLAWPDADVRLHWGLADGTLRPFVTPPAGVDEEGLLVALIEQLRGLADNPALTFANDLTVEHDAFRKAACHAQGNASAQNHIAADFIAAFACDALTDAKSGIVLDTAWRTMRGAGHQHFLGFMRTLTTETTGEQVRGALFAPWTYSDPPPSLRWDPTDDRRYALRWNEPSGDPIRTVRGANALAVQGLALFPTQPRGGALMTTGFSQIPRKGTFFTWPIWEDPLPLDVVRSVLALRELQADNPPPQRLRALGVVEVFRSQRITQGKYRNFTHGVPV
jgi:hypothetical protein